METKTETKEIKKQRCYEIVEIYRDGGTKMKVRLAKLRQIIQKVITEHSNLVGDDYVSDYAEIYAKEGDFEGYLKFGKHYGYNEEQLADLFDAAEDALHDSSLDSYVHEPLKRGKIDVDQLERDLSSGTVDLQKNPYALD